MSQPITLRQIRWDTRSRKVSRHRGCGHNPPSCSRPVGSVPGGGAGGPEAGGPGAARPTPAKGAPGGGRTPVVAVLEIAAGDA